jgi:GNAT superfamily N-acetyltransferase
MAYLPHGSTQLSYADSHAPPDAQRWAASDSYRLVGRDINRMIAQESVLFGNYTIRALDNAEFGPLFRQYRPTIFQTMLDFDVQQALSTEEQTATARLREQMGTPFRLNIGIYHQQEFIGWSFGRQESAEKYYMVNTAILPQHQGKGIYSVLLPRILGAVQREGFQIVSSRHVATNNQVLVPKLKAGFVITGVELSDVFGVLVHLSYFFNPIRRKVLDVRVGQARPDAEVKRYMPFE